MIQVSVVLDKSVCEGPRGDHLGARSMTLRKGCSKFSTSREMDVGHAGEVPVFEELHGVRNVCFVAMKGERVCRGVTRQMLIVLLRIGMEAVRQIMASFKV